MYSYTKKVKYDFENSVAKLKEELSKEKFGVLTEIDVKATMKNKLGVDIDNYVVLGACNPDMAHKALQAEKEVGLMLPCNVMVYEDKGETKVSCILPKAAMGMIGNPRLNKVAEQVEGMLKRVIDSV